MIVSTKNIGDILAKHNSKQYNANKLKEECLELALILTQIANKPAKIAAEKPDELYKELADVLLRVDIFYKCLTIEERNLIDKFQKEKMEKYIKWYTSSKYPEI